MVGVRMLPKVGNEGLAIEGKHLTGDWQFDNTVRNYMKRNGISEAWFQTYLKERGGLIWDWTHGIVKLENNIAKVTQFG